MKWRMTFAWSLMALAVLWVPAAAQVFSARRMAMGGVMLSGGGPGSEGPNVAYRAVPAAPQTASGFSLPIGLISVLQDRPVLDSGDPAFNAYELANLIYNVPWNYPLVKPRTPGDDITLAISRNSLAVDLGDVRDLFPDDHSRVGAVTNIPIVTWGVREFFASVNPVVHYENDLSLNDALHQALTHGEAFVPNTRYEAFDRGKGQAVVGVALGWAAPIAASGDPRGAGYGVYVGARAKLLRGIAYGDADNVVSFATRDTLFGTDPVDVGYRATLRDASPGDGGMGYGFDLGAAAVISGVEVGLGVNDIATRIGWHVRETLVVSDTSGDYQRTTLAEGVRFTSKVPVTVTASAATRLGPVLVAADVVKGAVATTAHAGAEMWFGRLALRGGLGYDANQLVQGSTGAGMRWGRFGVDVAVASHSRDITRERGAELGLGLAFYPKEVAR